VRSAARGPSWLLALVALTAVACAGTGDRETSREARVIVRGSDTMVMLAERWAEAYDAEAGVVVEVSGGGSGTGIAALGNGTTDVATASRRMTEDERVHIERERGEVVECVVALDAVAIYVHEDNPIAAVSLPEIAAIYRGRITRWSELGGDDAAIAAYSRENSSGTYAFFKEQVLEWHDLAAPVQSLPGTAAVIRAVARDRHAIGYGGIASASGARVVPLRGDDGTLAHPTFDEAMAGRYPLTRPLYVYVLADGSDAARGLVAWVLSPAAQQLVEHAGFFPVGGA
jgi:phosphate transport system substrate-binding protein